MEKIILQRLSDDGFKTIGSLIFKNLLISLTVERPWKNNEQNVSCIPVGTYNCIPENHPTKKQVFRLQKVKGRDGILIHIANSATELHGCIAPGMGIMDNSRPEIYGVANSAFAMRKLIELTDFKPFQLVILPPPS